MECDFPEQAALAGFDEWNNPDEVIVVTENRSGSERSWTYLRKDLFGCYYRPGDVVFYPYGGSYRKATILSINESGEVKLWDEDRGTTIDRNIDDISVDYRDETGTLIHIRFGRCEKNRIVDAS